MASGYKEPRLVLPGIRNGKLDGRLYFVAQGGERKESVLRGSDDASAFKRLLGERDREKFDSIRPGGKAVVYLEDRPCVIAGHERSVDVFGSSPIPLGYKVMARALAAEIFSNGPSPAIGEYFVYNIMASGKSHLTQFERDYFLKQASRMDHLQLLAIVNSFNLSKE
jgi:hypothetical protein